MPSLSVFGTAIAATSKGLVSANLLWQLPMFNVVRRRLGLMQRLRNLLWFPTELSTIDEAGKRRVVAVTGCDFGAGRSLALQLDESGCHVIAGCRSQTEAEKLHRELQNSKAVHLDICESESVREFADTIKDACEGQANLWALVNNAGSVPPTKSFDEFAPEDLLETINVNCAGHIQVVSKCRHQLREGGRVLLLGCMSVHQPLPSFAPHTYVASKSALSAYATILRREMRKDEVYVSLVEPGFHRGTHFVDEFFTEKQGEKEVTESANHPSEVKRIDVERLSRDAVAQFAEKSLDHLVNYLEHIVLVPEPRATYRIGKDAKMAAVMSLLPTGMGDTVFIILVPANHLAS
ncbi:MAG: hypothetical protein MHM6MM_005858 [Cercozoa sp. M6MM]